VGEMRNARRVLVGNPEVNVMFGDLRHRGERNIKMDLKCMRCSM
jgi:hypothetical protein